MGTLSDLNGNYKNFFDVGVGKDNKGSENGFSNRWGWWGLLDNLTNSRVDKWDEILDWEVIKTAGQMKSIDMILNFPVMDMNRNVLWSNPEGVDPADIARMNTFWGDDSWKDIAYHQQPNLFGEVWGIKESNRTIALAFKERLQKVAGFAHVSQPLPMRNSRGTIVYYLFFASQQQVADDIIKHIFDKYRIRGMQ